MGRPARGEEVVEGLLFEGKATVLCLSLGAGVATPGNLNPMARREPSAEALGSHCRTVASTVWCWWLCPTHILQDFQNWAVFLHTPVTQHRTSGRFVSMSLECEVDCFDTVSTTFTLQLPENTAGPRAAEPLVTLG